MDDGGFVGCKVALFVGERLLIILRDDKPDIPYPNLWDFPGGGREPGESAEQTLFREVNEEVGLVIGTNDLLWQRSYPANYLADRPGETPQVRFFVAQIDARHQDHIRFGSEGQGWAFVTLAAYLKMDQVVPSYADRLRDWLADTGGAPVLVPE